MIPILPTVTLSPRPSPLQCGLAVLSIQEIYFPESCFWVGPSGLVWPVHSSVVMQVKACKSACHIHLLSSSDFAMKKYVGWLAGGWEACGPGGPVAPADSQPPLEDIIVAVRHRCLQMRDQPAEPSPLLTLQTHTLNTHLLSADAKILGLVHSCLWQYILITISAVSLYLHYVL